MVGSCPRAALSGVRPVAAPRWSNTKCRNHPRCGSSTATPTASAPTGRSARSGHTAPTWPTATGAYRRRSSAASPGTPDGPWLRTGDLGFIYEGALFIVGRIKDLLIIRGSNHYPEDIEATVQEVTGGRVAAISVPVKSTEKLVTVIELKRRGDSDEEADQAADEEAKHWLACVKSDVTSAISNAHGLNVGDVVLVPPGSIPTTTSGKIRRAACVEQYRKNQFTRLGP